MTELEYVIKHGGLTPKRLLQKITRRGFGMAVLGGLAGAAASRLIHTPSVALASRLLGTPPVEAAGADFTLAIIPDPQFLAESCPDNFGGYYAAMMKWIIHNKNIVFTSSPPSFEANIKAVVGVGDCVNATGANEERNAKGAWTVLDKNRIAFTTPPGNHDYDSNRPSSRSNLGDQFATGYFSAKHRASVYGSGINLGDGDMAYWIGSHDTTGANTAVKFVVSGIKMLILAMDFFAGNAAWSWAYDVMLANSDCECYITTHGWLTNNGTQFQRKDTYGPDGYSMAPAPYSNSAAEAWSTVGVNTWSNLLGIFSGHDIFGSHNSDPSGKLSPAWYWQQVPIKSASSRRQTVQQLFANSQQIDEACSRSVSQASGAGQAASVFLLSRRPALRLLEGRMISTTTGDWFQARSASFPGGTSWSASETLLFSVPFTGLQ
ncbi:MAG: hypothetical protein ABSD98_01670 [Candidatus Korobacteraceae bacterium]|jgi:hypothetical protein